MDADNAYETLLERDKKRTGKRISRGGERPWRGQPGGPDNHYGALSRHRQLHSYRTPMLGLGGLDFSMRCKAVRSKTNNLLRTYSSMKQGKKGELAGRKQLCTVLRVGVDPLMHSLFHSLLCGLPFPNDATTDQRRCLLPTTTVSEYFFNFKSW